MPTGQAGSVVWPTDISRQEFNRFRRIGDVLGRFGQFESDVGIRLTLAEIENEVGNAQMVANDHLLDQDRLMMTENDEVLGVRKGRPYTKYEDQWKKRYAEIEKLPEGFTYPASKRRFLKWTAENKQRWQLGVEGKVQQRRASKISADSDKLGDMIATRLNVEDEVEATGKSEILVREARLRALADQNVAMRVWNDEQARGFVERKMKLARDAHSTKIENEVLGGALTIRNEDGEVNLFEGHKFIDTQFPPGTDKNADIKRKLTAAVAQEEAANFQVWNKLEGEKRDEWYDNLRAGDLAKLQADLDTFDSRMTGKWKSREVALKSEFQTVLDRRIKAEAAAQEKWAALKDEWNREIFGEITEALTQTDLNKTAAKVADYVKSGNLSVADGKSQQTEIGQRRTQLAEQANDFEAASNLEDRVFDIWTGAERQEDVQRDLRAARASDEPGVRITDGTYDRLFTLSQNQGKAYQGSAMKEADDLIDGQLITVSTSVIDSLIAALASATGAEEIDIDQELADRRDERKLQLWNANRARKALSGWLTENPAADSEAIDNRARRILALFDKDIGELGREFRAERERFLIEPPPRGLEPGDLPLSPKREAAARPGELSRRVGGEGVGGRPATELPRPRTQGEYDALPSGTRFIDTDGRQAIKK